MTRARLILTGLAIGAVAGWLVAGRHAARGGTFLDLRLLLPPLTAEQRAACSADERRLCPWSASDADLAACLTARVSVVSERCRAALTGWRRP